MPDKFARPNEFPTPAHRPFINAKLPEILALARSANRERDLGLAMLCAEEASHRATRTLKSVLATFDRLDFPPKELISTAMTAARSVSKAVPGAHYVYVILLYDPLKKCYGFYVGETSQAPRKRFAQHRCGFKAGRAAKRFGICLLPALFERFNPFDCNAADKLEFQLGREFRRCGLWVKGPPQKLKRTNSNHKKCASPQ